MRCAGLRAMRTRDDHTALSLTADEHALRCHNMRRTPGYLRLLIEALKGIGGAHARLTHAQIKADDHNPSGLDAA